jgi:hypothetical protein
MEPIFGVRCVRYTLSFGGTPFLGYQDEDPITPILKLVDSMGHREAIGGPGKASASSLLVGPTQSTGSTGSWAPGAGGGSKKR